jgi:Domain of unknown function (DUF5659)
MNQYETQDFYVTAYLLAQGIELIGRSQHNGIMTFIFPHTYGVSNLVSEYNALQSNVRPQVYAASIRNLKNILYSDTAIRKKDKPQYVTQQQRITAAQ